MKKLSEFLDEIVQVDLRDTPLVETMSGEISPRYMKKLLYIVNEALKNVYSKVPALTETYYLEYTGEIQYTIDLDNLISILSVTTEDGYALSINDPFHQCNVNILNHNVLEIPEFSSIGSVRVQCQVYPKISAQDIKEVVATYSKSREIPEDIYINVSPIIQSLVSHTVAWIWHTSLGSRESLQKAATYYQYITQRIAEFNRDGTFNISFGKSINQIYLHDVP